MDGVTKEINEEVLIDLETGDDQTIDVESLADDPSGAWSFETDHLALRGNKDYSEMLKTIAILEGQRMQAVKNLDTLWDLKEEAMKNPLEFLRKMQNGEKLGLPPPLVIAQIPEIDWSKYKAGNPRLSTPIPKVQPKTELELLKEEKRKRVIVRGRKFDNSKPVTFNQLWTPEEQHRLEELLSEFPPEEVEMRRWTKIANALGNRTAKQVSSRVQKYFLKLHRVGLPVPGRIPKKDTQRQKPHYHQRYNHMLFKPTTFFPNRPYMSDLMDDDDDEFYEDFRYKTSMEDTRSSNRTQNDWSSLIPEDFQTDAVKTEISERNSEDEDKIEFHEDEINFDDEDKDEDGENESVDPFFTGKVKNTKRNHRTYMLERIAKDKGHSEKSGVQHFGYKCDFCKEEPIIGSRWHCTVCEDVDFCTDCVATQLDTPEPHPPNHYIQVYRKSLIKKRKYDPDYVIKGEGCNYLDMNYMANE